MFSIKCFEHTTGNRRTGEVAAGCMIPCLPGGVSAARGSLPAARAEQLLVPPAHLAEKVERRSCPGPVWEVTERN